MLGDTEKRLNIPTVCALHFKCCPSLKLIIVSFNVFYFMVKILNKLYSNDSKMYKIV